MSYERIRYGTTRKPLRFGLRDEFKRVRWSIGTIQIVDAETLEPLPGFATPIVCDVSPVAEDEGIWLVWWPAYGDGAGELRAIEAESNYLVLWVGLDVDGGSEVSEPIPWTLAA